MADGVQKIPLTKQIGTMESMYISTLHILHSKSFQTWNSSVCRTYLMMVLCLAYLPQLQLCVVIKLYNIYLAFFDCFLLFMNALNSWFLFNRLEGRVWSAGAIWTQRAAINSKTAFIVAWDRQIWYILFLGHMWNNVSKLSFIIFVNEGLALYMPVILQACICNRNLVFKDPP